MKKIDNNNIEEKKEIDFNSEKKSKIYFSLCKQFN